MTPSTGPSGASRKLGSANAAAGASASAEIAQDRSDVFGMFTLTVELPRCWQALARRVNDTPAALVEGAQTLQARVSAGALR
jgi:hypothetical protein